MPTTVNEWLAVVGGVASVLSALVVWGFASGRFVQKRTDEVDDIRRRQSALAERVTKTERDISEEQKARHALTDRVNTDLGRLGHRQELIQQRMDIGEKHGDERQERINERLEKLEGQSER